jgi:ribonuclease Z
LSFKITILGCSGALPAYGRHPSSQLIEIQNRHFLVDAGEGTQMQLMRFQLPYHKINHVFITHLHGDHCLGLTGLLYTMHLQRRTSELHIYSQRGLDEIILVQLKHSRSTLNYKILFHPVEPDQRLIIFEDEAVIVETIPLRHKINCTGFLFKEKTKPVRINKEKLPDNILIQQIIQLKTGADVLDDAGNVIYKNEELTLPPRRSCSYAYCSDTAYFEDIIPAVRGVDLLYHEATFMEEEMDKAIETMHSTAKQAATIALKAHVRTLMIGHFSARYHELGPLLEQAKSIFPNTVLAKEGESIDCDP